MKNHSTGFDPIQSRRSEFEDDNGDYELSDTIQKLLYFSPDPGCIDLMSPNLDLGHKEKENNGGDVTTVLEQSSVEYSTDEQISRFNLYDDSAMVQDTVTNFEFLGNNRQLSINSGDSVARSVDVGGDDPEKKKKSDRKRKKPKPWTEEEHSLRNTIFSFRFCVIY